MDELFDPIWDNFGDSEMGRVTFNNEILVKVQAVVRVWDYCKVDHPGWSSAWLRPGFCECKPFQGRFKFRDFGNQLEHVVREE